jgi:hypothetical protein
MCFGAMTDMAAINNPATGKPGFNGYLGSYSWYWLETSQGVYNTSLIDADLAELAALSTQYGKSFKLIIQISYGSYAQPTSSCPNVPQPVPYTSASSTYPGTMPDYIISGVSGLGTDCFVEQGNEGTVAAFWRPAVLARWNALVKYLGQKYDGNPNVEAIIPIDQTADGTSAMPSDQTASAMMAAYESEADNTKTYWPTTNRIFTTNYNAQPMSLANLVSVTQYAANTDQFGLGGPDLACSGSQLAQTFGNLISQGTGGAYGTTDYLGVVPIMYQQQQGAYLQGTSGACFEATAWNPIEATHVPWQDDKNNPSAITTWNQVVTALQAQNFRIHSTCPTSYAAGCNTN